MINITDKTKCCGCASCANACPQKCIGMIADEEGFLYPEVNQNSCVNCGLCNKVCPIENTPVPYSEQAEGYVLRAKNQQVLMDSTSGGFFTPFAIWVLQQGGVVCA
ncbi:MAG: 4Fe-4S dicluster domain-containing protein, partial [Sedimentibacter sp.]